MASVELKNWMMQENKDFEKLAVEKQLKHASDVNYVFILNLQIKTNGFQVTGVTILK